MSTLQKSLPESLGPGWSCPQGYWSEFALPEPGGGQLWAQEWGRVWTERGLRPEEMSTNGEDTGLISTFINQDIFFSSTWRVTQWYTVWGISLRFIILCWWDFASKVLLQVFLQTLVHHTHAVAELKRDQIIIHGAANYTHIFFCLVVLWLK